MTQTQYSRKFKEALRNGQEHRSFWEFIFHHFPGSHPNPHELPLQDPEYLDWLRTKLLPGLLHAELDAQETPTSAQTSPFGVWRLTHAAKSESGPFVGRGYHFKNWQEFADRISTTTPNDWMGFFDSSALFSTELDPSITSAFAKEQARLQKAYHKLFAELVDKSEEALTLFHDEEFSQAREEHTDTEHEEQRAARESLLLFARERLDEIELAYEEETELDLRVLNNWHSELLVLEEMLETKQIENEEILDWRVWYEESVEERLTTEVERLIASLQDEFWHEEIAPSVERPTHSTTPEKVKPATHAATHDDFELLVRSGIGKETKLRHQFLYLIASLFDVPSLEWEKPQTLQGFFLEIQAQESHTVYRTYDLARHLPNPSHDKDDSGAMNETSLRHFAPFICTYTQGQDWAPVSMASQSPSTPLVLQWNGYFTGDDQRFDFLVWSGNDMKRLVYHMHDGLYLSLHTRSYKRMSGASTLQQGLLRSKTL